METPFSPSYVYGVFLRLSRADTSVVGGPVWLKFEQYKPGALFMDIGKQNSPRCEAAKSGVTSGTILFAYLIFIKKIIKMNKYS